MAHKTHKKAEIVFSGRVSLKSQSKKGNKELRKADKRNQVCWFQLRWCGL